MEAEKNIVNIRLRGEDAETFEAGKAAFEKNMGIPVDKSKFVMFLLKNYSKSE